MMSCQTLDRVHPEHLVSYSVRETPRASGTVSGFKSYKCFKSFRGFKASEVVLLWPPFINSHRLVTGNNQVLTVPCICLVHMHKCWLGLCATASSTRLILELGLHPLELISTTTMIREM